MDSDQTVDYPQAGTRFGCDHKWRPGIACFNTVQQMQQPRRLLKGVVREALTHAMTIWLFTFSDLKTTVGPSTIFGVLSMLSGPVLTTNSSPGFYEAVGVIPRTAFWAWINLLPGAIEGQRLPDAIKEDSMNKPWRPMPSKRLSQEAALILVLVLYPIAVVSSLKLGGLRQSLALIVGAYFYFHLGGADGNFFIRNLLNAYCVICFASGAAEVASINQTSMSSLKPITVQWLLLLGGVVLTSIHIQDMHDQAGDKARGRKTLPLVIGDRPARWTIAASMTLWSVLCPKFWELGIISYATSLSLSTLIALRSLSKTSIEDDKQTFRLWNLWLVLLYSLPLAKNYQEYLKL